MQTTFIIFYIVYCVVSVSQREYILSLQQAHYKVFLGSKHITL